MKIENLLTNAGNISVMGNPGTGKTSLLRIVVENALSLNTYDEIIIYARFKGEEYDELLKNKKVKLGKFLAPSLISQFFDGVELFPSKKQRLVILDDLPIKFLQHIHFSKLNSGFPLGHFEYTSTQNLNNFLKESKEDYWGDF